MLKKIKNKNKNNRKDKCMGKYKLVLYLILYNNKLMCYEFLHIYRVKIYNNNMKMVIN